MTKISYSGYRFPPEIIHQAIWLYLRFTLNFRDVEDLLAERGIAVSYETVRRQQRSGRAPRRPRVRRGSRAESGPDHRGCGKLRKRLRRFVRRRTADRDEQRQVRPQHHRDLFERARLPPAGSAVLPDYGWS